MSGIAGVGFWIGKKRFRSADEGMALRPSSLRGLGLGVVEEEEEEIHWAEQEDVKEEASEQAEGESGGR